MQGELIDDLVPRFWAGLKDNIVKGGHGDDAAALEHQLAAKFKVCSNCTSYAAAAIAFEPPPASLTLIA